MYQLPICKYRLKVARAFVLKSDLCADVSDFL